MVNFQKPIWLVKWTNYEYWPTWMYYVPLTPFFIYLAIRAKSTTFFTNINPLMENSGLFGYSKYHVLSQIETKYQPAGIVIRLGEKLSELPSRLTFPIIAKPDIGERGKGVKMILNQKDLDLYLLNATNDTILQNYCSYPYEAAIFYIRKPSELNGTITSFTTKIFMGIMGDGQSTIRELMAQKDRFRIQIPRMSPNVLDKIPELNEKIIIEPIGNHNRGTQFINSNHLISKNLTETFDQIAKPIQGFYYGRFDLKFKDLDSLSAGENFCIVELNGINSEPVHIYDQKTGIIKSYIDLAHHWKIISDICIENKNRGIKTVPPFQFLTKMYHYFASQKK